MSKDTTTNQHYVPQSYLRRFTSAKDQVYVFDKSKQNQFVTGVRNVASERYFYDLPADEVEKDTDLQIFEKMFGKIETNFAATVDEVSHLVETGRNMSRNQKQALAYFLHVQHSRTRGARNQQTEMLGKMLTHLVETQLKLKQFNAV